MSDGNWLIFFMRPIALTLMLACFVLLALSLLAAVLHRRDWRAKLAEVEVGGPEPLR
jgi:TctA family transporter